MFLNFPLYYILSLLLKAYKAISLEIFIFKFIFYLIEIIPISVAILW